MNHLFRESAPITAAGWEEIEKEAKRTLRALLAARRVVDFKRAAGLGRFRRRARPRRSDRLAARRPRTCRRACAASSRWSSCAFRSR